MKKIVGLMFLSMIMLLSLFNCGGGGGGSDANANLSALVVNNLFYYDDQVDFSQGTITYNLNVYGATSNVTITPTAVDGALALITVNGAQVVSGSTSGSISLTEGASTAITINVTGRDGETTKTYTINLTRGTYNSNPPTMTYVSPNDPFTNDDSSKFVSIIANSITDGESPVSIVAIVSNNDGYTTNVTHYANITNSGAHTNLVQVKPSVENTIIVYAVDADRNKTSLNISSGTPSLRLNVYTDGPGTGGDDFVWKSDRETNVPFYGDSDGVAYLDSWGQTSEFIDPRPAQASNNTDSGVPFAGDRCLEMYHYDYITGDSWFGAGFILRVSDRVVSGGIAQRSGNTMDLSAFAGGTLNFRIKTKCPFDYTIKLESTDGISIFQASVNPKDYVEYQTNGTWCDMSIPINDFSETGFSLSQICGLFMLSYDSNPTSYSNSYSLNGTRSNFFTNSIYIDEIYWSNP